MLRNNGDGSQLTELLTPGQLALYGKGLLNGGSKVTHLDVEVGYLFFYNEVSRNSASHKLLLPWPQNRMAQPLSHDVHCGSRNEA